MVSDIHLGNIVGRNRLIGLTERVNQLNPELVLLVGDIIDGDIRPFQKQNMGEIMKSIQAPLGVYAVRAIMNIWEDNTATAGSSRGLWCDRSSGSILVAGRFLSGRPG
jgi:predicted MPP superfamily phosphohydrolase